MTLMVALSNVRAVLSFAGRVPHHSTRIFFLLSAIQWDEGDNMPKIIRFHQLGGPEVLQV